MTWRKMNASRFYWRNLRKFGFIPAGSAFFFLDREGFPEYIFNQVVYGINHVVKGGDMFTQKAEGPRLLLVDDEERFRTTLAKRLKEKGFNVADVGSGMEAIDYVQANPVDIIVLDIKMPGLDGIETLAEIKKSDSGVEVVLLTGHGTVDTAIEGMRSGAYDYLMKPCEIDNLIVKINGAFEVKKERDDRLKKAEERSRLDKLEKSVRF